MMERAARRSLAATALTQYVRLDNCERYLHLQLHPRETAARMKAMGVTAQPLTPLLADAGARFETGAVERLTAAGYRVLDLSGSQADATARAIRQARPGERLVLYQATLAGQMGEWPCHGNADLIRVLRREDGSLDLLAADIKASKQDRLEHRLQVAFYAVLLEQMAAAAGERVASMAGLVVHREHQEGPLDLEALPHFDLTPYRLALAHLVSDPDAVVTRAADVPLEATPYHLSYKCDGCLFNAFCLQDTAQHRDLSMIPLLSGAEKRILHEEGISTVEQLAMLKELPPAGHRGPLPTAPGHERTVARLANRWRVGANLDLLSQKARAFAHRADPDVPALPYLWGTGAGSLPAAPEDGLPFVKVFADVQHDYLQDRCYLVGALVTGPGGAFSVVEMTADQPDDAAEAAMLRAWAPQVFAAVAQAAGSLSAHLHIYLYDQYDQRLLLEALRRHASDLNMTALFDLLTAAPGAEHPGEPGLAQPMISFLAQEVGERRNPALTCQPLHDVASGLGFDWTERAEEGERPPIPRPLSPNAGGKGSRTGTGTGTEGDEETDSDGLSLTRIPIGDPDPVHSTEMDGETDSDGLSLTRMPIGDRDPVHSTEMDGETDSA
ncbi:MAG: PD-(D/E)XK nuclease family protein, partial [Chloroflexi bacterium]|nr:PD-(D/E)XK nuclease family protein [Chloroflexota bacterium]